MEETKGEHKLKENAAEKVDEGLGNREVGSRHCWDYRKRSSHGSSGLDDND